MKKFQSFIMICIIWLTIPFAFPMEHSRPSSYSLVEIVKNNPLISLGVLSTSALICGASFYVFKSRPKKQTSKPSPLQPFENDLQVDTLPNSVQTLSNTALSPLLQEQPTQIAQLLNFYDSLTHLPAYALVHRAAAVGDCSTLAELLNESTQCATLVGPCNMLPIMYAAGNGHVEATQLLLAHGGLAHPNRVDAHHMTTLAHAAHNGQIKTCCVLMEYVKEIHMLATITNQFFLRPTPLHYSIQRGHFEIARYLLEEGAHTASRDLTGQTVLHVAVRSNCDVSFFRYLLTFCDNVNEYNREGKTPFDISLTMGRSEISEELTRRGGKTAQEIKDTEMRKKYLMAHILFKAEGNINMVRYGSSLLDLAREYHYADAEELLLNAGAKTAQELLH